MSVSKMSHEFRTIINVGSKRMSAYKIKKILRETNVLSLDRASHKSTSIDNQIDIGIYRIMLILDQSDEATKLRDYGRFKIRLYELFPTRQQEIDLKRDYRFKGYEWIQRNEDNKFCIRDLVQAILTCNKLDALKVFN